MVESALKVFEDSKYEENVTVTVETAQKRAACLSNVAYDVTLGMPKGTHFFGAINVSFDLSTLQESDLWLDFRGLKIANLTINDTLQSNPALFKDHHIHLPPSELKIGANTVTLHFLTKYRTDTLGLHSFTDKEDNT